jgi:hypothetical protein
MPRSLRTSHRYVHDGHRCPLNHTLADIRLNAELLEERDYQPYFTQLDANCCTEVCLTACVYCSRDPALSPRNTLPLHPLAVLAFGQHEQGSTTW